MTSPRSCRHRRARPARLARRTSAARSNYGRCSVQNDTASRGRGGEDIPWRRRQPADRRQAAGVFKRRMSRSVRLLKVVVAIAHFFTFSTALQVRSWRNYCFDRRLPLAQVTMARRFRPRVRRRAFLLDIAVLQPPRMKYCLKMVLVEAVSYSVTPPSSG
jgi:hypothetical protein